MKTADRFHRLAVGVALATVLFLVWAIGALGILGDGGRPDRMYAGVLAVVAIGTVIALVAGFQHNEGASVAEILGINGMYVALFSLSAWLFRRADQERAAVAASGPPSAHP